MPPFWFRRRGRKTTSGIKPLRGSPYSNIPRWLYERNKRIKTNPLRPSESTTTKDKKINVPKLQRVLMTFVSTINQLIDEINKIPPIEQRMDALEDQHKKDMAKVAAALASHAGKGTGAYGGTHSSGTSSGGGTRYKQGGKVKKKKGG